MKRGYAARLARTRISKLAGIALAASTAGAPTLAHAHAQSSVTLYGILDAGITYVNNSGGAHVFKFDDGVSYTATGSVFAARKTSVVACRRSSRWSRASDSAPGGMRSAAWSSVVRHT